MSGSVKDREFRAAVDSLETSLMTPRVPGELERWIDSIEAANETVGKVLLQQVGKEHRTVFKQITSQDPDLHARVERLKIGDMLSREQFDSLRKRVHNLINRIARVEPDEGRLESDLVTLCADGLSFVLHLRKQEVAIDTWLQEAFQRDRGVSG